ncbi:hypothetical protein QJQ45_028497 [Haematococcus lacustris]|nr:hypothetical protein QJQ45_028497 [Haematococcus lacustris]
MQSVLLPPPVTGIARGRCLASAPTRPTVLLGYKCAVVDSRSELGSASSDVECKFARIASQLVALAGQTADGNEAIDDGLLPFGVSPEEAAAVQTEQQSSKSTAEKKPGVALGFASVQRGNTSQIPNECLPKIAIVGRPNVGKSALFNRLAGASVAVVFDEPGVTRDRLYTRAMWGNTEFVVIDTGGLTSDASHLPVDVRNSVQRSVNAQGLPAAIERQAAAGVAEADCVVLLVDGKAGLQTGDRDVLDWLRSNHPGKPLRLAVNKCDNVAKADMMLADFWELGMEPFPLSAITGTGTAELLESIMQARSNEVLPPPNVAQGLPEETPLSVAIVGRPNVVWQSRRNAVVTFDGRHLFERKGLVRLAGGRLRPQRSESSLRSAEAHDAAPSSSSSPGDVLIEFRDVHKSFGDKAILRGASFTIRRGEAVGIIGASGTGKSTTLRIAAGLLAPDRGEVLVMGKSRVGLLADQQEEEKLSVGMVFQNAALFDSLTVGENVGFLLYEHSNLPDNTIQAMVADSLAKVGLRGVENLYPAELSGGMKKRVALARAVVPDQRDGTEQVIMYDEPTAGLDPVASTVVEDLMRSLHNSSGGGSGTSSSSGGGGRQGQANRGISSYVVVTHQHSTIRKSSLLNAMCGEERVIVCDMSGTTRDAVDTDFTLPSGQKLKLIDTAGIRKRTRVASSKDGPEQLSVDRALRSIRKAEVVVALIDASEGITQQDFRLTEMAAQEGRAVVVVVNKWDKVDTRLWTEEKYVADVRAQLRHVSWATVVCTTASSGKPMPEVVQAILDAGTQHRRRVSTATLNMVLNEATAWKAPPTQRKSSRKGRIYYATQAAIQPPTFVFFVNDATLFGDDYKRYMERALRDNVGLQGTSLRIMWRSKPEKARGRLAASKAEAASKADAQAEAAPET